MTDKEQIMIDGVDVSECLFYQVNFEEDYNVKIEHFCSNWHNSCESVNNSNCYYKQLAHKTQECEELKEKYKRYEHYEKAALYNKDLCNKKSDEIACYKQTLKKIKKIVSNMSSYTAREERQIKQILQACEVLYGWK